MDKGGEKREKRGGEREKREEEDIYIYIHI